MNPKHNQTKDENIATQTIEPSVEEISDIEAEKIAGGTKLGVRDGVVAADCNDVNCD
jgi:hypothetical protein